MILIATGHGKGKTTAAMGQVMRACGHGQSVCVVQLFKPARFRGEQKILARLGVAYSSFAPHHPRFFPAIKRTALVAACRAAMRYLSAAANRRRPFNLIVLDEFTHAVHDGFITSRELCDIAAALSARSTVFITGRHAPRELIQLADTVTEMKEIKHAFRKSVQAKKGIEY